MEYVEGATLAEELRSRRKSPRELLEILRKAAEGLDHAHRNGVVHRDVKPSNVIVDPQGRPRLADFGLALLSDADSQLTATGAWLGTPAYMSPELARGAAHEADLREVEPMYLCGDGEGIETELALPQLHPP